MTEGGSVRRLIAVAIVLLLSVGTTVILRGVQASDSAAALLSQDGTEDQDGTGAPGDGEEEPVQYADYLGIDDLRCPPTDRFRFGIDGGHGVLVFPTPRDAWMQANHHLVMVVPPGDFELFYVIPNQLGAQFVYRFPLTQRPGIIADVHWTTLPDGEEGWMLGGIVGCSSLQPPSVEAQIREEDAEGSPESIPEPD